MGRLLLGVLLSVASAFFRLLCHGAFPPVPYWMKLVSLLGLGCPGGDYVSALSALLFTRMAFSSPLMMMTIPVR